LAVALRMPLGQRSETVRRANLSAIVRELHGHDSLSRTELVARTGLTRSAVRVLLRELVTGGLALEETGRPEGGPGRPSLVVRANPAGAYVLALEIAVDSLAAALVGLGGKVEGQVRLERPRGHFTVDEVVGDLVGLARQVLDRRGLPAASPTAVGVAVVAAVRRRDGFLPLAPNLGWVDVPLGDQLFGTLGLGVPVLVANEADLGALAELRRGAAAGERDIVFVSGEVGVGGGVFIDGRLLRGTAGYAGEVGHMAVNPDGILCGCGSAGCWETEVGERALLRRAGYDIDGGRPAVDAVLAEAETGEPRALAALDEVGTWLGRGLATLVNVFNPRLVVLGGLFGRIYRFVEATVARQLGRLALAGSRENLRLAPAALGIDAPLMGAAEIAFEPILADPAAWLSTTPLLATA
jgi:predicted NBD/HSP70 family sugar kinase